jgi:hypothetical protein
MDQARGHTARDRGPLVSPSHSCDGGIKKLKPSTLSLSQFSHEIPSPHYARQRRRKLSRHVHTWAVPTEHQVCYHKA